MLRSRLLIRKAISANFLAGGSGDNSVIEPVIKPETIFSPSESNVETNRIGAEIEQPKGTSNAGDQNDTCIGTARINREGKKKAEASRLPTKYVTVSRAFCFACPFDNTWIGY